MISAKLDEIASCLYSYIKNETYRENYGLYNGDFGILLFLYYYAGYSGKDKFARLADSFTDELLNKLEHNLSSYTFCSGLSGILYLLDYLKEKNILGVELGEAQDLLDRYIASGMRRDMQRGYYDFLHGALGAGVYFLKKGRLEYVNELIDFLYDNADWDSEEKIFKWKSVLDIQTKEVGYNISLSHGISSIAVFLSQAVACGVKHEKLETMLCGTVNYLLSQRNENGLYGSYFPSYSQETPGTSRLGWCYGDLGVAFAIYHAGKTLRNQGWVREALEVLRGTTRRTPADGWIRDAGICHGSAGVALIYRRMYLETGEDIFFSAVRYWVERTLAFSTYEDGLAGYKALRDREEVNDYCLLTGVTGIGLFFISYLADDTQDWDQILLLS